MMEIVVDCDTKPHSKSDAPRIWMTEIGLDDLRCSRPLGARRLLNRTRLTSPWHDSSTQKGHADRRHCILGGAPPSCPSTLSTMQPQTATQPASLFSRRNEHVQPVRGVKSRNAWVHRAHQTLGERFREHVRHLLNHKTQENIK